jgi:hypothetical protein
VYLVASEGLERTNRLALRCSFYLENKKYRFFGHSPLPMKGRERSSLRFANRVHVLHFYKIKFGFSFFSFCICIMQKFFLNVFLRNFFFF